MFIALNMIQENTDPNIQFLVISFDHTMINHGVIEVMRDDDEIVIGMPKLSPGGSTCTDLAFAEAVKVMERGVKVTDVIIITDGQTNSSTFSLQGPAKKLDDNGVLIKIIAVTYASLNPETLSKAEERNIPGMDVVNMLQNFISRLEIQLQEQIITAKIFRNEQTGKTLIYNARTGMKYLKIFIN
jgi:hypothetical protein